MFNKTTAVKEESLVWIGNLGKYNEGVLQGEWFELPVDMEEVAEEIGLNGEYEEFFIGDYDGALASLSSYLGEYPDLDSLNEIAEKLEEVTESHEQEALKIILEEYESEPEDAIAFLEDSTRFYFDCSDMGEVAQEIMEETGQLDSLPEMAQRYFDFDAMGRDLEIEGNFQEIEMGVFLEIIY